MFSKEFSIDGVKYLLKSSCEQQIWPKLCDRVEKHLIRFGEEAAKSMFGTADARGKTAICHRLVEFKLTVNPQGNNFQ